MDTVKAKKSNAQESSDESSKESYEGAKKPETKTLHSENETKRKKQEKNDGLAFNYIESGFDGKFVRWGRAESSKSKKSRLLSSNSYVSALDTQYFNTEPKEPRMDYLKPVFDKCKPKLVGIWGADTLSI